MPGQYGLIEPFPTNDLQFALGVEWQMVWQELKHGRPFTMQVTTVGLPGIIKMVEHQGRFCESRIEDGYPDWSVITVGGEK